jgi:tetratricopeptide (TPR) repeat protein
VFSFDMLPHGTYELVADRESASIHQRVEVQDGFSAVTLRFDTSASAASSQNGLVSIAELKVPQRARDAYMKAEQAIVKHRPSEVSKYLEKSLEIYPAYAPALTLRGIVSLDKNDLAAAVEDFEKAIHADSGYATAYSGLAAALNKLKKYDDALRAGERASSLSPNAWQPYFEMAKSYAAKADHHRALQQLTHAQGLIAKDFPPLHLLRAGILLGLNSYEEAAAELRFFLKIAPNDPNASVARDALAQLATFPAGGAAVSPVGNRR